MNKKRIIMITAAGLISFAGAFVFAWLTTSTPVSQSGEPNQATTMISKSLSSIEVPRPEDETKVMKTAMGEKQLKSLVYEVREKIQEYEDKLRAVELREQRLQTAQNTLKEDIENLNNLRVELASIVASLKSERDKLLKSRLEVTQTEKVNLLSIAATYDKMDVSGASKILTNMCAGIDISQMQDDERDSFDDAVKILYYMTERTKAKLLAELATSEPTLAAVLCQRLKQIVEGN